MAATPENQLATIAQLLQIKLAPQYLDNAGTVALAIAADLLGPAKLTGITETMLIEEVVAGPVDLDIVLKNVRFITETLPPTDPFGGMPIPNLLIPGIVEGPVDPAANANAPGVPGLIATVGGTLPIKIQTPKDVPVNSPLMIEVVWFIVNHSGDPASDVAWSFNIDGIARDGVGNLEAHPPIRALVGGGAPIAPLGLLAHPLITELRYPPQVSERRLGARVRLTCAGHSSGWVDIPPVRLPLPLIPVPTIFAGFREPNHGGHALVVMPTTSPIGGSVASVVDAVNKVMLVASPINNVPAAGGGADPFAFIRLAVDGIKYFLNKQGDILAMLSAKKRKIVVMPADRIDDLDEVTLEDVNNGPNIQAGDEFQSVLLLGPPKRQIRLYNEDDCEIGEGQLRVTADRHLYVDMDGLNVAPSDTDPPGRASVPDAPTPDNKFSNEISSLRFRWA